MTKVVKVRDKFIGGKSPKTVQTMYDRPINHADPALIVNEIGTLAALGCDLIRFSFVSEEDSAAFSYICKHSVIPVVADIHFDYKMALLAFSLGADKVRINPGNIGAWWKTEEIVRAALDNGCALRIGLNAASLPREERGIKDKSSLMVRHALDYIDGFEKLGFENTVVSLKSSDMETTLSSYREFSKLSDYPLHIGVTEAGSTISSAVKSTWVLGNLLNDGIGDTLRVSINGSIENEVIAGVEILKALNLRKNGVKIVACPRCGRHTFDSQSFLEKVEKELLMLNKNITVAIMGCSVNGPGEARSADIALTGNGRKVFLYKKGELVGEIKGDPVKVLLDEVKKYE